VNLDWPAIGRALDAEGFATTGPLLDAAQCRALAALYEKGAFRSRVVMARHNFGQGEYKYFAYPLPPLVARLRAALYPPLAQIANDWAGRLGIEQRYPAEHETYLERCRQAGQQRPTPLLLRYGPGDYNCLHQDLYGEEMFPLQATILLSAPGAEFEGGEFVLVEQRPRAQSKPSVVPLTQGEAVIFAVRERPVRGTRGDYRTQLRHGVSRIRSGARMTLGLIFHDAA
jgi:hypothetical protein